MKAAILGNGNISREHRQGYQYLKDEGFDLTLQAVCDIRPERLEENDGAHTYTSLDEMLAQEPDLDFIDICLPTFLHAEYAIKCMKAGYHVLCEKPMALTPEETQRMLDCAKETGRRLMIAHSSRFCTSSMYIKRFLEEGRFGKPTSVFYVQADGFPLSTWDNNWFSDGEKSGGCLLDLQAHTIDLIHWYFGLPKAVSVVGAQRGSFTGYTSASCNYIYPDGLFAHTWCDWSVTGNQHQNRVTRFNFEHGYLILERGENLKVVSEDGTVEEIAPTMHSSAKRNEIEYFANCLKNNVPFTLCDPEESAQVITIMRAQEKSANQDGAPVYLTR